jgi:hypothetical protein
MGSGDHEMSWGRRANEERQANKLFSNQEVVDRELLYTLAGKRIKERGQAAVRIDDLNGILQLPPKPQVKAVSAPPTAAEYNLLKRDVEKLYEQLALVAAVLQGKITTPLPKTKIA